MCSGGISGRTAGQTTTVWHCRTGQSFVQTLRLTQSEGEQQHRFLLLCYLCLKQWRAGCYEQIKVFLALSPVHCVLKHKYFVVYTKYLHKSNAVIPHKIEGSERAWGLIDLIFHKKFYSLIHISFKVFNIKVKSVYLVFLPWLSWRLEQTHNYGIKWPI